MFAFLKTLRKSRPYLFFGMVLLCGFFLFPSTTFAAETSNEMIKRLLDLIIQIEKVMYALLVPAIGLIGKLLSNEWVTGAGSTIEDTIQLLWVFIRNMVNIVFVVILLVVALMHVMNPSGDQGNYAIKAILPRLVIAIVAVNFSLFACRVVLDFSNTLTTAVFSIPNTVTKVDTFKDGGMFFTWTGSNKNDKECLRKHYYLNLDQPLTQIGKPDTTKKDTTKKDTTTGTKPTGGTGGTTGATTTPTPAPSKTDWSPFKTSILVPLKECKGAGDKAPELKHLKGFSGGQTVYYCAGDTYAALQNKKNELNTQCITSLQSLVFDKRNAMYAFAFGLLRLPAYEKVLETDFTLDKFFVSTAVAMIFLAMISLVVFAMATAFLVRSVVLWGLMALSPLWVLDIVFSGGGPEALKKISEKASFKAFLGTAMMPVYVGAVLSASFVMLLAVKASYAAAGAAANQIGLGNVTLHFGDNPIFSGVSNIQDMLFSLMVIAALWVAVFAALKAGDATGAITKSVEGFENIGNSVGKFATELPTRIPMIPTPFGGRTSLKGIRDSIDTAGNARLGAWDKESDLVKPYTQRFSMDDAAKSDFEKYKNKTDLSVTDINQYVSNNAPNHNLDNKTFNAGVVELLKKLPKQTQEVQSAIKAYSNGEVLTKYKASQVMEGIGATDAAKAYQEGFDDLGRPKGKTPAASSPSSTRSLSSVLTKTNGVYVPQSTKLNNPTSQGIPQDRYAQVEGELEKLVRNGFNPEFIGVDFVTKFFTPGGKFKGIATKEELRVYKNTALTTPAKFTAQDIKALAADGRMNDEVKKQILEDASLVETPTPSS